MAISETIAAMYDHLARFWVEALFAKRLLRDSSWQRFVRVQNEAGLHGLRSGGRGCVLATAYYGNPAVAALALGQIFRPVYVLVDFLAQPQLRAWQRELYAYRGVRPIERSDAARVVPDVLRRGGAVLMICEHERSRGRAVPTPFLGCELECYPTLGRLARWFDVPVGVVTCRREEPGPFSFVLSLHDVVEAGARPRDALLYESRLNVPVAPASSRCGHRLSACATPWIPDEARIVPQELPECAPNVGWADAGPEPACAGSPVIDEEDGDAVVMRRVLAALEREILTHPEQYYWSMPTRTETGTAASRRTHRTASDSRRPSAAGRSPGSPEAVAAPAPKA